MAADNLLKIADICRLLRKGRWTIHRYRRELNFPEPINDKSSPREWRETDVLAWANANNFPVVSIAGE